MYRGANDPMIKWFIEHWYHELPWKVLLFGGVAFWSLKTQGVIFWDRLIGAWLMTELTTAIPSIWLWQKIDKKNEAKEV